MHLRVDFTDKFSTRRKSHLAILDLQKLWSSVEIISQFFFFYDNKTWFLCSHILLKKALWGILYSTDRQTDRYTDGSVRASLTTIEIDLLPHLMTIITWITGDFLFVFKTQNLADMAFCPDFGSSWCRGYLVARLDILIFITFPSNKVSRAWFCQRILHLLIHQATVCHILSGKFPHFLVKFMKAAVCLFPSATSMIPFSSGGLLA